jgi:hypothetical protein
MKTVLLIVVTLAVVFSTSAATYQKFDLSGEWVVEVQTEAGSGSPTFVFKQDGDKLTGKYKGILGEAEVTGTVTGKTVRFSFSGDAQGTAINVIYEGEIESDSAIKGKVDLGGMGSGTFTGKKVK